MFVVMVSLWVDVRLFVVNGVVMVIIIGMGVKVLMVKILILAMMGMVG